jgi:two-component system, NarL family, nitrate/nitrite response regulator NarL
MNILLCSTNKSLRDRWKNILERKYPILEAESEQQINSQLNANQVDLLLLHRSMIGLGFISAIEKNTFLIMADVPMDSEAVSLLRQGASGYTNACISAPRLLEAVEAALSGRIWIGRSLMQKIIRGTSAKLDRNSGRASMDSLTEREKEVALLVRNGLTNLEIAAELDISERTVKAHIGAIFKKTRTSSRLQLALLLNTEFSSH